MIQQFGVLFYPLFLCSCLALILIIERILFVLRLVCFRKDSDLLRLKALLHKNKHLAKEIRDELISVELGKVREKLEFGLKFLRMLAMLSPMLGLLGTIIGIIDSFKVIAVINESVTPALIADGLWEAMLTTAYGLALAIIILFFTFILARIIEKRVLNYQLSLNNISLDLAGVKYSD